MGKGDDELFEKKLSKEEKKALAKAKREAKKKDKAKKGGKGGKAAKVEEEKKDDAPPSAKMAGLSVRDGDAGLDPDSDEAKHEAALEDLARQEIVVTYEQRKGKIHANTRDINVGGVSVAFHGKLLLEETDLTINYGNRYGFIGPNGSGKVRAWRRCGGLAGAPRVSCRVRSPPVHAERTGTGETGNNEPD